MSLKGWAFKPYILLLWIVSLGGWIRDTEASISFKDLSLNTTYNAFPDKQAAFGPGIPKYGIEGVLQVADPLAGCTPLENNLTTPWIALIIRSPKTNPCEFVEKVKNAEKAGAVAAIVYNNAGNRLVTMSRKTLNDDVSIPSVFIGQTDGEALKELTEGADLGNVIAHIYPSDASNSWQSMIESSFIALVALSVVMAAFFFVRRQRIRQHGGETHEASSQALHLTQADLKAIPTVEYAGPEGDEEEEVCSICLEEYVKMEKLRVLGCGHKFHMQCIDAWLSQRSMCPMCKQDVCQHRDRSAASRGSLPSDPLQQPLLASQEESGDEEESGSEADVHGEERAAEHSHEGGPAGGVEDSAERASEHHLPLEPAPPEAPAATVLTVGNAEESGEEEEEQEDRVEPNRRDDLESGCAT